MAASARKFDPERAKRQAARVDANWAEIAAEGTDRFLAGLKDERPWEERTVADVYAAKVAELVGADKRVKRMTDAPRVAALIMMQPRFEGMNANASWEAFAKAEALTADQRRELDAIPAEVVQCEPGDGQLPGELGTDLRKEGAGE